MQNWSNLRLLQVLSQMQSVGSLGRMIALTRSFSTHFKAMRSASSSLKIAGSSSARREWGSRTEC